MEVKVTLALATGHLGAIRRALRCCGRECVALRYAVLCAAKEEIRMVFGKSAAKTAVRYRESLLANGLTTATVHPPHTPEDTWTVTIDMVPVGRLS